MEAPDVGPPAAALLGRWFKVLGLELRATDIVLLGSLLFFTVLALVFNAKVPHVGIVVLTNAAVGLVFLGASRVHRKTFNRTLAFWIRLLSIQMMFAYVFPLVTPLQLILSKTWNDSAILRFEDAVFGVQPTFWIQKFISPPLTEWLMFAYVVYLALYPVLCLLFYRKRGELAMEDFVFKIGLANLICDIGFILYPVAGPLYWIADRYTVPLQGYLFTSLGEFVRAHLQGIGASLPSPHCTVATIMLVTAYRLERRTFFFVSPIILSIYVSAFYARYHYLSDVLLGILTGAAILFAVPRLTRVWDARHIQGTKERARQKKGTV
jgi:hypothetical protein